MSAESRRIRTRRVRFDWSRTPLHWVPGDPFTSHVIDVLHVLLPAGEYWFCDVYRQALPLVRDPALEEDVRGFIGQEATHSRAHSGVLEHLAEHGIDAAPFTRWVEWLFDHALGDRPFGWNLPELLVPRWLVARLAIVAAIEHFTTVLGTWIVEESDELDRAGADPTMLDLLRWHGAEEVEHRAVAFDLYQHVSGNYVLRVAAIGLVAPIMFIYFRGAAAFLLRSDPLLANQPVKGSIWRYVQVSRTGRLPRIGRLLASIGRYVRPSHHPSHEGSTEKALAYLAISPAATAAG